MAVRPLDHVVIAVDDLDETAGELISLGFHVTDRSDHPFGTSNRLVVLENSYIELVGVTDSDQIPETGFGRFLADTLAEGRSGPVMVALRTDDPDRDARRVAAAGMAVSDPSRFGRWVDLPNGERGRAEFITVLPEMGSPTPAGFFCRHLTPELVWRPEVMAHPNGATSLLSVSLPDPGREVRNRLALLAGAEPDADLVLGRVRVGWGGRALEISAADELQADVGPFTLSLHRSDR